MVPIVRGVCGGSAVTSRSLSLHGPSQLSLGTTVKPWSTQLLAHHQLQQQHSNWTNSTTAAATNSIQPNESVGRMRRTRGGVQKSGSSSSSSSSRREQSSEADMDVEDMFLDPEQAAKLRRMVKAKGLDAVVDSKGIVKVSIESSGDRDSSSSSSGGETSSNTAAAAAEAADVSTAQQQQQQQPDISSSSFRSKLFSSSQLKAAAPGSKGTVPVLPIVRPSSSSDDDSSSSSSRGKSDSMPPWARTTNRRPGGSFSSRSRNEPSAAAFFSSKSWEDLKVTPEVLEALKTLGITKPSHIQAEAYKALSPKSDSKHVAIADQAGSGKTLAYLLPLLQQLKQREAKTGAPGTTPNSPSIIIMAPTTELVQQVGRVVRALSSAGLRVRSAIMTGGQAESDKRSKTFRTQCEQLESGVDVLISTPGRLLSHLDKGSLKLHNTAALVMDEVDVLAGGEVSYSDHIAPLRAAAGPGLRCVLVSATLPQHTFDELQELFVGLGAAFGPGLHKTATGCTEELVDCSGGDDISLESGTQRKLDALLEALDRVRSPRTMVFCNKIETCRVVENALNRKLQGDAKVLAYHEAIKEDARVANLTTWLSPPTASQPPMILVCTDRTSRGIDSMWCEHVVLFEFPRDPSEYVRRVGRTARGAGGKGVVTVLVLGKQVALAKDILSRNKTGAPVHRVPRLWDNTA